MQKEIAGRGAYPPAIKGSQPEGGTEPPGWLVYSLVFRARVDIIRDGEIDLVDNPVSGTLAHAAGHPKELPGCVLGE